MRGLLRLSGERLRRRLGFLSRLPLRLRLRDIRYRPLLELRLRLRRRLYRGEIDLRLGLNDGLLLRILFGLTSGDLVLCGDNERYLYLNFRNYKILNKIIFQKLIENY